MGASSPPPPQEGSERSLREPRPRESGVGQKHRAGPQGAPRPPVLALCPQDPALGTPGPRSSKHLTFQRRLRGLVGSGSGHAHTQGAPGPGGRGAEQDRQEAAGCRRQGDAAGTERTPPDAGRCPGWSLTLDPGAPMGRGWSRGTPRPVPTAEGCKLSTAGWSACTLAGLRVPCRVTQLTCV